MIPRPCEDSAPATAVFRLNGHTDQTPTRNVKTATAPLIIARTFKPLRIRPSADAIPFSLPALAAMTFLATTGSLQAAGILRDGAGARSTALGGADVALAEDPLSIMHANPAGLGWVTNLTLSAGAAAGLLDGKFTNPANPSGHLKTFAGGLPEGALVTSLPDLPFKLGFSVIPEGMLLADWRYQDSPGGLSGHTVYDSAGHKSQLLLLRSTLGLGYAINDRISLGASFGVLYNENVLEAPYIFQSNPALGGAKTLLDLHTAGIGFDGQAGVLVRPAEHWQAAITYRSRSVIKTTGTANGTADAEFKALGVPEGGNFNYDAGVVNVFPQTLSVGLQWQPASDWKLLTQVDWINWSSAFHNLRIHLANGNNPTINSLAGGSSLDDAVPLNWRDQFAYRLGTEWRASKAIAVRVGYSYARNPVPTGTLTPMTAAIFEHALCTGVGWTSGSYAFDLAYEFDLPSSASVGTSGLKSGEYNQSHVDVIAHLIAVTVSKRF